MAAAPPPPPGIEIVVGYRGPSGLRTWPNGRLTYGVAGTAVGVGLLCAWAVALFARRRRWVRGAAIAVSLALAIVFGLGSFVGLHAAVAAALFFGTVLGTVFVHLQR
jgi:hypothetical protein